MASPDAWLASHLRSEVPRLLVGAGALVVASFVNFRTGAQLKSAIEAAPGAGRSALLHSLALFGAGALAGCVRTIIFDSTAERLRAALAAEVFAARLLAEPSAAAEAATPSTAKGGEDGASSEASEGRDSSASGSSAMAAMDGDVTICADSVLKFQNLARYTSSVVGGSFAMFRASWKLSAVVWPLLVTGAMHGARAGARRAGKAAQQLAAAREDALVFAEERIQHQNLVRWFSRADLETVAFREKCRQCVAVATKAARGRGIAHLFLDFISKGVLLGLCHIGTQLVKRGELTAGELTSFFFHASFLGLGLYGIIGLMPEVANIRQAAKRLAAPVAAAGRSPKLGGSEEVPCLVSPPPVPVRFEDVGFGYTSGKPVLDHFTLEIPAGSTCALAGPSGSGKSTAVALLLRDFDPASGRILIGGQDVRDLSRDAVRRTLAVAPQQSALIDGSVSDAIGFAVPSQLGPASAEIEAAARAACAHGFVAARPGGYASSVGRGGGLLSGGERQRLSLARALVRRAPVLVLDEPTSALDAATAAALAEAVLAPRPGRPTTLVVTHSLAVIRSCDTVAVLSENGRVVQHGTYAKLIADQDGALAQIIKAGCVQDDVSSP